MKSHRRKLFFNVFSVTSLSILFLFGIPATEAEQEDARANDREPGVSLQIQAITPSRMEEPAGESSGSLSVLREEEIEIQHPVTGPEVLRDMPGVRLQESGTVGESAALSLRGAEATQTLIMMEGVRLNDPYRGRFDIGNFFMDEIGQVEIVRGAQSALYGSDAIGGVINFRIKRPKKPFELSLLGEGGTENSYRSALSVEGFQSSIGYSLTVSGNQTDGQFQHDFYRGGAVSGSMSVSHRDSGELRYLFRFQDDHKDLGIDLVPISATAVQSFYDGNSNLDRSFLFQSLQLQERLGRWLGLSWKASFVNTELDWDNPPDPINSNEFFEETDTRTLILDFQQDLFLTDFNTFSFGVEWMKESAESDVSFSGISALIDENRWNTGYYLQNLLKWEKSFILQAGVRIDDNSDFETVVNPKVSAAYAIEATKTKLRGSFGKGFHAPTIQQQFFPVFGNPNLKPEKANSWEAGFRQGFWEEKVAIDAAYFRIDYTDLIQISPMGVDNIGKAQSKGVEVGLELRPTSDILLKGNYTFLEAKDNTTGEPLPFRPKHQGNLTLGYSPTLRLTVNLDVNIVSDQELSADFHLIDGTILEEESPGYTRVDLSATYYILGGFKAVREGRLFVKIRNLFDKDYESIPGFPSPGFGASGGMIFYF